MNYDAYALMSIAVWRMIATIREPILQPIKAKIVKVAPRYGVRIYNAIIWLVAFVIGYGYATIAGDNGDMLKALGWTSGYTEYGYAMTAGLIACGSGGLRVAEKLLDKKTSNE